MLDLQRMTEEEAEIIWRYGYGSDCPFPGKARAVFRMIRAIRWSGRRSLGRYFASLAPHAGAVAILALIRAALGPRPVPAEIPAPAPVLLAPQTRGRTAVPTRAP